MPAVKQTNNGKYMSVTKGKASSASSYNHVKASPVTKEAVKSNADRHREAMIRLANR